MLRVPALALLACFILGLAGSYPVERFMRLRVRQEMRAWIRSSADDKDVVSLSFPLRHGKISDPDLAWHEEDEFSFGGQWFDVVDKVVNGDRITLRCVRDGQEERLIARFASLNTGGRPGEQQSTQALILLLGQHYLPQAHFPSWADPVAIEFLFALERPAVQLPSALGPPAPPPKVAA